MRLRSVLMFGAGYFLGTKAGRERYQEITQSLRDVVSSDMTRQVMDKARASLGMVTAPGDGEATEASAETGQESGTEDSETEDSGTEDSEDHPDGWQHAEGGAWVPEGSEQEGQEAKA